MRGIPTFWGKLERDAENRVVAWHPLADHCADVAAVCERLLRDDVIRRRLARLGETLARCSGAHREGATRSPSSRRSPRALSPGSPPLSGRTARFPT
jgi:hypothetical protein